MLCKIAELLAEVPAAGGLAPRCEAYLCETAASPNIVIREENYRTERYDPRMPFGTLAYMEAAYQFYLALVDHNGFYLHSSAVLLDGRVYLFSGPSRAGKSTHTRLWQQTFGPEARVINDDKPAIRLMDGKWIGYGTPWCGKDGINENASAPIAGVCFLKKAPHNAIRKLSSLEAATKILTQTIHKFDSEDKLDKLLELLNRFVEEVPVYELENLPEQAAAMLSYETMRQGALEAGL